MNIGQKFERRTRLLREILETLALTGLMFLVINLAVQNYDVDGPSMEPSLHNQERIMVDKVTYLFHAPARGDVVVFLAPPQPTLNYFKRIIAIPGDVITIEGTTVIVDGVKLNEPYVDPNFQGNPYPPIINRVIPPNDYFVLGDDRRNSSDSRDWGFLPRSNIIGRAALVYWPLGQDNTGFLPNVSAVFASVHQRTSTTTIPLKNSTFDADGMFLWSMPALFLVCSKRRNRRDRSGVSGSRVNYAQKKSNRIEGNRWN